MLLTGKPVVSKLKRETKQYLEENKLLDSFVAIFLLSDDHASEVYVSLKSRYAQKLGMYADIKFGKDWSKEEILEEIQIMNGDHRCLGIMVQLPLAPHLQDVQGEILDAIDVEKDIDGLTSAAFGRAGFGYTTTIGATPRSAFEVLDHYKFGEMVGKKVLIVSQSNLIGKRLVHICMARGATILSANHHTSEKTLAQLFAQADIVFSATGQKHLIGPCLLDLIDIDSIPGAVSLNQKVLVDIGRGSDEDGAYGDIDWKYFEGKVKAVTPVPGSIGPVTVACLFANMVKNRK